MKEDDAFTVHIKSKIGYNIELEAKKQQQKQQQKQLKETKISNPNCNVRIEGHCIIIEEKDRYTNPEIALQEIKRNKKRQPWYKRIRNW